MGWRRQNKCVNELQPDLHQSLSHPVHSSMTQNQWKNYFYWVTLTFISPIHAFLTWVHGQILTLTMIIAQTSWGKCFNGKTSVCIPWALSFWPCPQEVLETLWWSWFEMCLFVNFLTFALLKQHSHHHGWISHFPGKGGVLLGQRWRWSAFVRVRQARSYPWSSKLWSLWGSSC